MNVTTVGGIWYTNEAIHDSIWLHVDIVKTDRFVDVELCFSTAKECKPTPIKRVGIVLLGNDMDEEFTGTMEEIAAGTAHALKTEGLNSALETMQTSFDGCSTLDETGDGDEEEADGCE